MIGAIKNTNQINWPLLTICKEREINGALFLHLYFISFFASDPYKCHPSRPITNLWSISLKRGEREVELKG